METLVAERATGREEASVGSEGGHGRPGVRAVWPAAAAAGLLAAVVLAFFGWRLRLGVNLTDEAIYPNLVVQTLREPAGDSGDCSPYRMFGVLLEPAVRLYAAARPDLTGLVLFLRVLYAVLAVACALAVGWSLRRMLRGTAVALIALLPVMFIPFGLPAVSYNTAAMLGTLAAFTLLGGHLVRAWEESGAVSGRWRGAAIPVAAAAFALSVVSFPTILAGGLVFLAACAAVAPAGRRWQALAHTVAWGAVFLAAAGGAVVARLGPDKVRAILEFDRAVGTHFDLRTKAALCWQQVTSEPQFVKACVSGAVLVLLALWRGGRVRTLCAIGLAMLAAVVMTQRLPVAHVPMHDVVLLLALAGLPLLLVIVQHQRPVADRVLAALYAGGLAGGAATAATAAMGVCNFPVGGLPAAVAVLAFLARPPAVAAGRKTAAAERMCRLVLPALVVGLVAWGSLVTVYDHRADVPVSRMHAVVPDGAYAGLRTSPEVAGQLAALRAELAALEGSGRTIEVVGNAGGPYLLTTMKPKTLYIAGYFEHYFPRMTPRLEAYYADPANRADVMLDASTRFCPINPVQKDVLERHYLRVEGAGPLPLYVRQDLPP